MDPLCHSLIGAALAEAGLKKRTALATATLLIGANLPDVDVLAYAWGSAMALGFRRGWTHGILALALWPFILTGAMLAWDRFVRRRRHAAAEPADPRALLFLSAVAILSHPFLDWLNTYGLRWLMPFRDVWYHGDVLFIVDPWIWLALGIGWLGSLLLARRGSSAAERPARAALILVAVYILCLGGAKLAASGVARQSLAGQGIAAGRLMAGPVAVNPFRRQIVAEAGDRYALATVDWLRRPVFAPAAPPFVNRNESPEVRQAVESTREGRIFLRWARFPFYQVRPGENGRMRITVLDARYRLTPGRGIGTLTVEVPVPAPAPLSLLPSPHSSRRPILEATDSRPHLAVLPFRPAGGGVPRVLQVPSSPR
ncbi:MAG: metal-dependent hydrolase [Thermoanaerobaculia bacterium]